MVGCRCPRIPSTDDDDIAGLRQRLSRPMIVKGIRLGAPERGHTSVDGEGHGHGLVVNIQH